MRKAVSLMEATKLRLEPGVVWAEVGSPIDAFTRCYAVREDGAVFTRPGRDVPWRVVDMTLDHACKLVAEGRWGEAGERVRFVVPPCVL
jgi:hypothetical protein